MVQVKKLAVAMPPRLVGYLAMLREVRILQRRQLRFTLFPPWLRKKNAITICTGCLALVRQGSQEKAKKVLGELS